MRPVVKAREIELDFIRGIAILLVLEFHAASQFLTPYHAVLGWADIGWAGVDVFFVLSGFLVGGLLVKEWKLRGRVEAGRFLVRRGFKIWPQYYAFLLLNLLTGRHSWHELRGNLLNVQNYTGGIAHTWTLAVEEHAYLLLALCIVLAARAKLRERTVFSALAGTTLAVLVWRFLLAARGIDTFVRTDTRIDGIFYGVLLAMLFHLWPARFARLQSMGRVWAAIPVAAFGVTLIPLPAWWMPPAKMFAADMSGVAALLLLYRRVPGTTRGRVYRSVACIGLYSYGIYLWHVTISTACGAVGRHLPTLLRPVGVVLVYLAAAIALGALTTLLIEFPALALRDRLFPGRTDPAAGTPATVEEPWHVEGPAESRFAMAEPSRLEGRYRSDTGQRSRPA